MKKPIKKKEVKITKAEIPVDNRSLFINEILKVLEGQAKPSILAQLTKGKKRLAHIQDELKTISARTLAAELKILESNSLIRKIEVGTMPVIIEYELTTYGQALNKILDELYQWADHKHKKEIPIPAGPINPWKTDH